MKNQKGEIVLGAVLIAMAWTAIFTIAAPDAYYQINKAESCEPDYSETKSSERKVCYAEKHANDVGMTLIEK